MNTPGGPADPSHDPLREAVRKQRARRAAGDREASLAQSLALTGVLAWMVVLPPLGGAFVGRWLDARLGSGVFWTLGLLVLGLALGCLLAWRRIHQ